MDIKQYLNRSVIFGAIGFAAGLIIVTLIFIGWTSPRFAPEVGFAPADLTMVPPPPRRRPPPRPIPPTYPPSPPLTQASSRRHSRQIQSASAATCKSAAPKA